MSTIISVENVSKLYRLGEIGTGSLAHDVNRWWHRTLGKEDPYLQVGISNDRTTKGDSDYVYAVKNVTFEVKQGEVLGIIGRNGAGKSTLLKILSRVTTPTTGQIKVKGRIASLLEVGTGFHPELTGRENIFLNGAIMGMKKAEIRMKFDEIVEFSGCERYIDTPVKRFSSGMYVRLAFAVAAHLEPEILVVDEVLAVGDLEFQQKCMGKMKSAAMGGRTVLFVSHNMAAIKALTSRAVLMDQGEVIGNADTETIFRRYLDGYVQQSTASAEIKGKGKHATIRKTKFPMISEIEVGMPFDVEIEFETDGTSGMSIELFLKDPNKARLAFASVFQFEGIQLPTVAGIYLCRIKLRSLPLAAGTYFIDIATSRVNLGWDHEVENAHVFTIPYYNPNGYSWDYRFSGGHGVIAWTTAETPIIERLNQ